MNNVTVDKKKEVELQKSIKSNKEKNTIVGDKINVRYKGNFKRN